MGRGGVWLCVRVCVCGWGGAGGGERGTQPMFMERTLSHTFAWHQDPKHNFSCIDAPTRNDAFTRSNAARSTLEETRNTSQTSAWKGDVAAAGTRSKARNRGDSRISHSPPGSGRGMSICAFFRRSLSSFAAPGGGAGGASASHRAHCASVTPMRIMTPCECKRQ